VKYFVTILPVLTLIAGWFLNEISQYIRIRHDTRKALSRSLAVLLEVRTQMLFLDHYTKHIITEFGIPEKASSEMKLVFQCFLPDTTKLVEHHEQAVLEISASNPLLGFRLFSAANIAHYFHQCRALLVSDTDAMKCSEVFEKQIVSPAADVLKVAILELAWKLGVTTWLQTKRLLMSGYELPPEVGQYLQQVKKSSRAGIACQSGSQVGWVKPVPSVRRAKRTQQKRNKT
jgi:hypothetical protein